MDTYDYLLGIDYLRPVGAVQIIMHHTKVHSNLKLPKIVVQYPLGDRPRLVRVVSLNKLQSVLSHICDSSPPTDTQFCYHHGLLAQIH